jgi:hypothetical protein
MKIIIILMTLMATVLSSTTLAQWWWVVGVTGLDSLPWVEANMTWAQNDWLVSSVIQTAVNRVLGILAFIALLILLYAGFLMLTAAGDDDRYNKWFTILKQVALWLVMIWLAWLIVSMIFYLIDFIT